MHKLWTVEKVVNFSLQHVEKQLFNIKPGISSKEASPLLKHFLSDIKIESKGEKLIVISGSSKAFVAIDKDHHKISIQGEWWYRGEYQLKDVNGKTLISYSVYNVALGFGHYLALFVARGEKRKILEEFKELLAELEHRISNIK